MSASSKHCIIRRNCTYKVMITPAVYSDFLLQKTGLDWSSFEAKATGSGISLASVLLYSLFNPDKDRCNGSEVMCLYIHQNVCSGYLTGSYRDLMVFLKWETLATRMRITSDKNSAHTMLGLGLRTSVWKFSNIDFFLKILPLKDDE